MAKTKAAVHLPIRQSNTIITDVPAILLATYGFQLVRSLDVKQYRGLANLR